MPTATLKCRCGCKQRARRETMLIIGSAAFVDTGHARAYLGSGKPKKAKPAKPKAKKKKLKSIARLVDDAAVLLQLLVRMKAADSSGMVKSFTSGKVLHYKDMQGSHFIQRNRVATKLLEENVHPQTPGENMYDMKTASGVLDYRRAMVDFYGEDFVQWLERESKKAKKYTRSEVEGIIFDFKRQIQQQESRLSGREVPQQSMEKVA